MKKFEDIKAWQKARGLDNRVYDITKKDPFAKDFALKDQIRKASNSIMLNIAEGFTRFSTRTFKQFLVYSRGSTGEVQSCLHIALNQGYITKKEFDELYNSCSEISKMITGLIIYLLENPEADKNLENKTTH